MTTQYLLDTNIVSELIRNPHGTTAQRVREANDAVCTSIIVAAELRYGATKKASRQLRNRVEALLSQIPVLPFGNGADSEYGAIRTELEAAGTPIGANDLLIAAQTRFLAATLVTANTKEFGRVARLKIENWLESPAVTIKARSTT